METENQTEETQVDESQLNSATGNEAESAATDSLTLSEINALTGKDYKDKDSALKSIKDMSSMAGKAADLEGKLKEATKVGEPKTGDEQLQALQEQLSQTQTEVFLANNPDHKDNRDLLEQLAKANNCTVEEATQLDVYKGVTEKVASQGARTVASPNKRVAQEGKQEQFNPNGKSRDELADFVTKNYF